VKTTGHAKTVPRPANPDVRRRLLAAGLELLHSRGFHGSGVKDFTDAAGVPKGSFYNYFASKEDYASAVLETYWTQIELDYGPILTNRKRDPTKRIARYFRALTDDHGRRDYTVGCLIGNLALELAEGSTSTRDTLKRLIVRWETALAGCLAEAQDRGEIDAQRDARELAALLVEAWEGAVMRGKLEQSRAPYRRFELVTLPRLIAA
jgi:TetR/AcrR family transcriptional repressor of nem operon